MMHPPKQSDERQNKPAVPLVQSQAITRVLLRTGVVDIELRFQAGKISLEEDGELRKHRRMK